MMITWGYGVSPMLALARVVHSSGKSVTALVPSRPTASPR